MVEAGLRCGRRVVVFPSLRANWDQRRRTAEEAEESESLESGRDRLLLDLRVLYREYFSEVQTLLEEGEGGMDDLGQRPTVG